MCDMLVAHSKTFVVCVLTKDVSVSCVGQT